MDEAKLKRFGNIVRERRLELGLTQDEVTERGGPSDKRQTKIENGQPPVPSVTTLRNLDVALEWEPGSAAATLRGGNPTVAKRRPGMYTSEEVERRVALELALARHGIDRVAARHHASGPGGGLQLGAKTVDQLIEVLNSIPGPAETSPPAADSGADTSTKTDDDTDQPQSTGRPRRRRRRADDE
ncbi:helix-turn-helix transcriptional regulator [Nocardia amamiensis]|uniref:helix-turn-helix transcriptional regulator n=1 Tax=Nocardia amamiensis TaxID=404578 RepID=UPI0012F4C909|nr:helix-turn-helix domain-containing protein [Nocardia amamiensis]